MVRIATYNVEWFDRLFDDTGAMVLDDGWSGRRDVTRSQQAHALKDVFRAMDADVILVVEGPDTGRTRDGALALEQFAAQFNLRTRRALIGFANNTQQELLLLYDPEVVSAVHTPLVHDAAPGFETEFSVDLDTDGETETVVWSKPPLEVALEIAGQTIQFIGVHAKSKAPHGARDAADAMRLAIANRRKQLAQCVWLRRRVDGILAQGLPLIVAGDFNDGPGLDRYEALFGRSGVEVVLGRGDTALFDPHAETALANRFAGPTTSRFWLREQERWLQALLDYVMVSDDLRTGASWRIWHPFDDPDCYQDLNLRRALLTASDHFPVTCDLPLG